VTEPTPTPAAAPRPVGRIFTATLIIGVPGAGKTSLAAEFSTYLWETFRRVLLLYSWDGGAIPTDVQKRMKQGLIRFWRARTRSAEGLGIETLYLATKGYWPRSINPETGETTPAITMVPPVTTKYAITCPQGHPIASVPAASLIVNSFCATCKQMIPRDQLRVREDVQRTRGFEAVGGVLFDGLTSMCNVVMEHMDHARGSGQIGGEKAAFGGVVQSGSIKLGGNNRADVGFGQSRAQQFVNNALSIPHLVEGPIFTALTMEATDEGGLSIVGAKLPGRAATDEASSWFGNVAEMGKTTDDTGKSHFTLFLRPFTDAQGRRHLLKTSASPAGLPAMLVDPAEDAMQAFAIANLGNVFRLLDDDLRRALLTNDVIDAPGTPSGIMEYGEAATIEVAPPTASASGIAPLTPTAAPIAAPAVTNGATRMPPKARPKPAAPAIVPAPPAASSPAPEWTAPATATVAPQGAAVAPPPPAGPPPVVLKAPAAVAPPLPAGTGSPPPPGMKPPQRAPGS